MADEGLTLAQRVKDRYPGVYDHLSDQELEIAVQRKYPGAYDKVPKTPYETASAEQNYTPNVFQKDLGTSAGEAVVGAAKNVAGMVPALISAVRHPQKTLEDMTAARYDAWNKGNDPTKNIMERGAYKLAGVLPVVGPAMVAAGERLGSGDPETMGAGAVDTAMLLEGGSPSVRAGTRAATKRAASAVGDVVKKVPGGARIVREVTPALKTAGENPLATAYGAWEGYQYGGVPGAVAGAMGLPTTFRALLKYLGKDAKPVVSHGGPKAERPRLVDPRVEQEVASGLSDRLDGMGTRPTAADAPTLDQVMAERLAEAADSPARAGASTEFTRPNPNAGGELVPGMADMADELGTRIDSIPRNGQPLVDDAAAAERATAARLADAAGSPARAGATTEFMRSKVEANPNAGGTLKPRLTRDVVQEVLDGLAQPDPAEAVELQPTGETPLGQPAVTRGGQTPETLARGMAQETLTPQEALAKAEAGVVPEAPPTPAAPKGVDPQLRDVLERQALAEAAPPVAPEPPPPMVGRSKSKRPTYTENDLKAAKEKWGSADIAELRQKFGQEVDDYLLAKRAERHQKHYSSAKDQAAARRMDLGGEGLSPEQLRTMLLDTMKQRSGK